MPVSAEYLRLHMHKKWVPVTPRSTTSAPSPSPTVHSVPMWPREAAGGKTPQRLPGVANHVSTRGRPNANGANKTPLSAEEAPQRIRGVAYYVNREGRQNANGANAPALSAKRAPTPARQPTDGESSVEERPSKRVRLTDPLPAEKPSPPTSPPTGQQSPVPPESTPAPERKYFDAIGQPLTPAQILIVENGLPPLTGSLTPIPRLLPSVGYGVGTFRWMVDGCPERAEVIGEGGREWNWYVVRGQMCPIAGSRDSEDI